MNIDLLKQRCSGAVLLPGSGEFEQMRRCWNTAVELHPKVIVVAANSADMQAAVRFAAQNNLKVLVQSTGHGARAQSDDYLLIVTTRMRGLAIDVAARTARIEAGAVWGEVLKETQRHGLAPLLGSSGTVGVVGYTLSGGIGWLTRNFGLAVDSVLSIDVVMASGEMVRATSSEHPDLYWALCGGLGCFGVVAAIEVELVPVSTVWGGTLTYPVADAAEAFARYREWTATLPPEMTSAIGIMNFPDVEAVPPQLRRTTAVIVSGCCCGPASDGKALTTIWTDWKKPQMNTFAEMPFAEVASISKDPVQPVPAFAAGGDVFAKLSDEAIAILIEYATTDATKKSGRSPFVLTEVRHIESQLVREPRVSNAFTPRHANFVSHVVASVPKPESMDALHKYAAAFKRSLRPHTTGEEYASFSDSDEGARGDDGHDAERIGRLRAIKREVDPENLLIAAHPPR